MSVQAIITTAGLAPNWLANVEEACCQFEAVVVATTDEAADLVKPLAAKLILVSGEFAIGPAVNLATRATTRDWLLVLHDDVTPPTPAQVDQLLAVAQEANSPIVAPSIIGSSPSKHQTQQLTGWSHTATYLSDACYLVKREFLRQVGGCSSVKTGFALAGLQWKLWQRLKRKAAICHDVRLTHLGDATWSHYKHSASRFKDLAEDLHTVSSELGLRFDSGVRLAEPSVCDRGSGSTKLTQLEPNVWSVGQWRLTTDISQLEELALTLADTTSIELATGESIKRIQLGDSYTTSVETLNVLVVPPLGLGDVIFTLKGLSSIKRQRPGTKINVFTTIGEWADIMRLCQELDSVTHCHVSAAPTDSVFVHRFGYVVEGITYRINDYFGLQYDCLRPTIVIPSEAVAEADELVGADPKPKLGLLAHGNWKAKRWKHHAALAHQASLRGFDVIALGERLRPQERIQYQRELGRLTLPTLAAVLSRCSAIVGFDSGIVHLASILDVPSVSLWGPNDPRAFLLDHTPKRTVAIRKRVPELHCGVNHCRAGRNVGAFCPLRRQEWGANCLDDVTTGEVWEQLERVLN